MIGIVVFSFALRAEEEEPNPCNVRLAEATYIIHLEEVVWKKKTSSDIIIVAQWEVARALEAMGRPAHHVVKQPTDGKYLSSHGVWQVAKAVFEKHGIREVIPVANPFLHLRSVEQMIERDGYTVLRREVRHIGFDRQSKQWWTRGPLRLLAYAIKVKLSNVHGHKGRQQPT